MQPSQRTHDLVFYDGECGFCHRTVRFLLRRDADGARFRFAPLGGACFRAEIPPQQRAALPDAMAVLTRAGKLLCRTDATAHLLRALPAPWPQLGALLAAVPRPLRDAAYAVFARWRYRLFGREAQACPVLAPELRARFHLEG